MIILFIGIQTVTPTVEECGAKLLLRVEGKEEDF
jgi:hypothetical protein